MNKRTPNDQLNLRKRHPDFQSYLDFNKTESERVSKKYQHHFNVPYGSDSLQTIDIFPSPKKDSPILLFIHGGYWRGLDKESYRFIAEPYLKRNIAVGLINYRLIPQVSMVELLSDATKAIAWVQQNAFQFNGTSNQIILSGHSAGGHIALMSYLMHANLRPAIIGLCSLSGLFDLAPIQNSYLNDTLQLSDNDVEQFSTIDKDLSIFQCPTLLTVGGDETQLFQEESKNLFHAHQQNQFLQLSIYNHLNHYQIVHQLGNENHSIAQFIFECSRNN